MEGNGERRGNSLVRRPFLSSSDPADREMDKGGGLFLKLFLTHALQPKGYFLHIAIQEACDSFACLIPKYKVTKLCNSLNYRSHLVGVKQYPGFWSIVCC